MALLPDLCPDSCGRGVFPSTGATRRRSRIVRTVADTRLKLAAIPAGPRRRGRRFQGRARHESMGGPDVPSALWKASRRHMVFVDPQGRTIFSNRRMAEILRGRISNRCRTIRFCPRFRQPLRRSVTMRRDPSIRKSEVKPPNLLVAHAVAVASVDWGRRKPATSAAEPGGHHSACTISHTMDGY